MNRSSHLHCDGPNGADGSLAVAERRRPRGDTAFDNGTDANTKFVFLINALSIVWRKFHKFRPTLTYDAILKEIGAFQKKTDDAAEALQAKEDMEGETKLLAQEKAEKAAKGLIVPEDQEADAQTPVRSDGHLWKIYANPRFGVSICYPSDLVRAEPPPEDGDGQSFVADDGAKIAAWGSFASDETLAQSAQTDVERLEGQSGRITYKVIRKDFYVVSGQSGDTVFYNRTALSGDVLNTVEISYPASRAFVWDKITARVSKCFHHNEVTGDQN